MSEEACYYRCEDVSGSTPLTERERSVRIIWSDGANGAAKRFASSLVNEPFDSTMTFRLTRETDGQEIIAKVSVSFEIVSVVEVGTTPPGNI